MVSDGLKIRNLVLIIVLGVAILTFPVAISLGNNGFENIDVKAFFNFDVLIGGIGLLLTFVMLILYGKTVSGTQYGPGAPFNDPGEFPAWQSNRFKNPLKLFMLSLVVFSAFGIGASITQQNFIGIGVLEQQFSPADSVLFNGTLIPAAENIGAMFISLVGLWLWLVYAKKYKITRSAFRFGGALIFIAIWAIYGFVNHQARYGANEPASLFVLIFWAIGGALTFVSGSFIPFWVAHIANNLFGDVKFLFSNDYSTGLAIILFIVSLTAYFYFFRKKNKQ